MIRASQYIPTISAPDITPHKWITVSIAAIALFDTPACAQNNPDQDSTSPQEQTQTSTTENGDGENGDQLNLQQLIEIRREEEGHVTSDDVARVREEAARVREEAAREREDTQDLQALTAEARRRLGDPDEEGRDNPDDGSKQSSTPKQDEAAAGVEDDNPFLRNASGEPRPSLAELREQAEAELAEQRERTAAAQERAAAARRALEIVDENNTTENADSELSQTDRLRQLLEAEREETAREREETAALQVLERIATRSRDDDAPDNPD